MSKQEDKENESRQKRVKQAAERALKEAKTRKQNKALEEANLPKEINGRGGLEPVRYNDWEIKGLTVDF